MRKALTRLALVLLVLAVVPVVASGVAHAQTRQFTGKVDKITDKQLIVDNRKGDKLKFIKVDETEVAGLKTSWGDVKKKDWVTVDWKFVDNPRKAYKVTVIPSREEED